MADDDLKTLLKIEGDASGAKKAAAETKAAALDMGDGVQQSTTRVAESTQGATRDLAEQTEQVAKGSESFGEYAKKMGTSERAVNAFREAIGRVSPELAGLIDIGSKAGDILNAAFSKLGIILAGIAAGVAATVLAFQKLIELIKEAKQALEDFAKAQERIRTGARQEEGERVRAAAAAGLKPESLGRMAGVARELERLGVDRATANQIAPQFIDEARGGMLASQEERLVLAIAQQFGFIQQLEGRSQRERVNNIKLALRRIRRPELNEAVTNAVRLVVDEQIRGAEEMAAGMAPTDIEAYIESKEGLAGKQLKERADKVIRQLREGPGLVPVPQPFGRGMPVPGVAMPMFPEDAEPGVEREELDPLVPALRRRVEQLRGSLRGLEQNAISVLGPAPARVPTTQPAAAGPTSGAVIQNNFGWVVLPGALDKTRRVQRAVVH